MSCLIKIYNSALSKQHQTIEALEYFTIRLMNGSYDGSSMLGKFFESLYDLECGERIKASRGLIQEY